MPLLFLIPLIFLAGAATATGLIIFFCWWLIRGFNR